MLARIRRSMDDRNEGFTLIELLVVIIIIGILAAIAIPVFLNQRKKAFEASMKSDLRSVANEEETYFVDKQQYAAVTTDVPGGNATVTGGDTVSLSNGNVIVTLGTYPANNSFCLKATATDSSAVFYYDSKNGGLSHLSTICTSS